MKEVLLAMIICVLLIGGVAVFIVRLDKDVVTTNGEIYEVSDSFDIPKGWKIIEKIGENFFVVIDKSNQKWLFKQNITYYGYCVTTFSKME